MKKLVSFPLGSQANAVLTIENGNINAGVQGQFGDLAVDAKAGYPVAKLLAPVKTKFVDKLKALIPGTLDDQLIDKAWAEAVDFVSEAPAALPEASA